MGAHALGHYKTKDLVKWEPVPCALAPDQDYDCVGVSPAALWRWQGRHYQLYTGVSKTEDGQVRQTQSVAVGDGLNYEKLPQNPVMTGECSPRAALWRTSGTPKSGRKGTGSMR